LEPRYFVAKRLIFAFERAAGRKESAVRDGASRPSSRSPRMRRSEAKCFANVPAGNTVYEKNDNNENDREE